MSKYLKNQGTYIEVRKHFERKIGDVREVESYDLLRNNNYKNIVKAIIKFTKTVRKQKT